MQNGLPAWCGVLAIEVPRSGVLRHGGLQIRHPLIQNFHFALGRRRGQQSGNAVRDGGIVKGVVDLAHVIHRCMGVAGQLFPAGHFNFFQELGFSMFFQERDGGPERHKPPELAHVNAIAVGIADLGAA